MLGTILVNTLDEQGHAGTEKSGTNEDLSELNDGDVHDVPLFMCWHKKRIYFTRERKTNPLF